MVKNLLCEQCSNIDCCAWFNKVKPFTNYAKNTLPVNLVMEECEKFNRTNENEEDEI